jgi:hypothetical protein
VEPSFTVPASFRPVFTAGTTISRGISTMVENVVPFIGLVVLAIVPMVVVHALLYAAIDPAQFQRIVLEGFLAYPIWFWPLYLGATVASFGPGAAIMHASALHMEGRSYRLGDSLAHGYRRALPMVFVYLIFSVVVGLGVVALLVPGIILACMLFMVFPVTAVEQRGVFGAFGRAAALSKGYRTTLFAIGAAWFAIALAMLVGMWLVSLAVTLSVGSILGETAAMIVLVPIMAVAYLGIGALGSVLASAAYVGLREEKESGSAEQVAGVFS